MDWSRIYHTVIPYLQQFATIVIIPVLIAFIKSEKLALDNSTQANGLVHGWRLLSKLLAVVPDSTVKAVEAKADTYVQGSGQLIETLTKEDAPNEISTSTDTALTA